jgi:hypothetical protein
MIELEIVDAVAIKNRRKWLLKNLLVLFVISDMIIALFFY